MTIHSLIRPFGVAVRRSGPAKLTLSECDAIIGGCPPSDANGKLQGEIPWGRVYGLHLKSCALQARVCCLRVRESVRLEPHYHIYRWASE